MSLVFIIYGRNNKIRAIKSFCRVEAAGLDAITVEASNPDYFAIIYRGKRYEDVNTLLADVKPEKAVVRSG